VNIKRVPGVAAGIGGFEQNIMSAVFPETFVLFHLPGRLLVWRLGGGGYGRGLKIRDRCTYPLDSLQALPRVLKHFKEEWRPKDDDTLLYGLPLQFFSRVHFSLPLAAAGELDSAVGYELLRHIPYELDSVYFTYSYRVSPSSEDALEVDVSLAPRQPLAPFLQAMSAAGLELSAIFPSLFLLSWWHCQEGIYLSTDGGDAELLVWQDGEIVFHTWHQAVDARSSIIAEARPFWENLGRVPDVLWYDADAAAGDDWQPEGMTVKPLDLAAVPASRDGLEKIPGRLSLISPAVMKRRQVMFWFRAACFCFFLLAVLAYPVANLAGKNRRLAKLERRLQKMQPQVEQVSGELHQNQAISAEMQTLARLVQKQPVVADLLREITELLPADSYLTSVRLEKYRLYLRGYASSAAGILELLENSPFFKDVHFDSPVISKGSQETFKIVATLEQ